MRVLEKKDPAVYFLLFYRQTVHNYTAAPEAHNSGVAAAAVL